MEIPQELINNALALTNTHINFMGCDKGQMEGFFDFSIEKFCYYLLSPEFIEKYHENIFIVPENFYGTGAKKFGEAIYEYQGGDSRPLIYLLSKI